MNTSNISSTMIPTDLSGSGSEYSGYSGDGENSGSAMGSGYYSGDDDINEIVDPFSSNHYYPLIFPAVIIVLFNTFIVLLVWLNPKLHRNCNVLLVSLAVADGATGLIGIPLFLITALGQFNDLKTHCFLALSTHTWFWFMSICSIFHLLIIALEQYLAILKPFNHAKIITKLSVTLTLTTIWLVSLGMAFIPWSWIVPQGGEFCDLAPEEMDKNLEHREKIFITTACICFFFIPVSVIIYVYFRIVMEAKHHISRIKRDCTDSRSDSRCGLSPLIRFRGFYIIAFMWLVFMICWTPFFVTVLLETYDEHQLPFWMGYMFTVLRFLPSLLNPMIFMFWKSDLRASCKEMFKNCRKKHSSDHINTFSNGKGLFLNRLSADCTRQSLI